MNLIKAQITNFGCLSNQTFDFSSGLNVIYQENGFGKSTLAAFIKAMFYGFIDKRASDNERNLYCPWNGRVFGGSLTFLFNNKTYRIERTFGKTKKNDNIKVYNASTNTSSNDFDINRIGEEVFGLPVSSYEKSTYFAQKQDDMIYGEDIKNRLANLLQISNGSLNYEEATNIIKTKINSLYANKNKGMIVNLQNKIESTKEELLSIEVKEKTLAGLLNKYNKEKNALDNINDDIKRYEEDIIKSTGKQALKEQLNHKANIEKEIKELEKNSFYPLSLEDLNKLEELDKLIKEQEKEELIINNSYEDCSSKIKQLNYLKELNKEKLNTIKEMIDKYNLNLDEAKKYDDLNEEKNRLDVFFKGQYNKEKINLLKQNDQKFSNKPMIFGFVSILISLISLVFAIIFSKNNIALTIVFGFVFVVFILGGLFLVFMKKLGINLNNGSKISNIKYLMLDYDLSDEEKNDITLAINRINLNASRYEEVSSTLNNISNIKALENKELKVKLDEFFISYQTSINNYLQAFGSLETNYNQYLELTNKEKEIIINKEEITNKINKLIIEFNTILNNKINEKYSEFLINKLLNEYQRCKINNENKEKKIQELNSFILEKHLNENEVNDFDLEFDIDDIRKKKNELDVKRNNLTNEMVSDEKDIARLESEVSIKNDLLSDIDENQEEISKAIEEKRLLEKTSEYLRKAKDELSSNFIEPIEKSLTEYLNVILEGNCEVTLDADLNLYVKESGIQKDLTFYSQGYTDIISVCMHLALCDNLYDTEKPVIVLDDPFVNLDDEKLKKAKELIDYVSEKYQVIYFICHSSRKLD